MRLELRDLSQHGLSIRELGTELEPGAARHSHLREQPQTAAGFVDFDAPKVERAAGQGSIGIAAAAAHPNAACKYIY
jgi:hypothetical protein